MFLKRDLARFDQFLDGARRSPKNFYLFFTIASTVYSTGSVVAPQSNGVARALFLGAQALTGLFSVQLHYPVLLGNAPPIVVLEPVDESYLNILNWMKAYYLGAITRQRDLLAILDRISYQSLMASTTGAADELSYRFVDLMKVIWQGGVYTQHPVFVDLRDFCNTAETAANKYVRLVTTPLLDVLAALELGDPGTFNDKLYAALQGHKKYWSSSKKLRELLEGVVSLPLTAVAALAHDRGLPIEVESDYTPRSWVTGEIFQQGNEAPSTQVGEP